jgi:hypothetical protein
VCPHNVVDRFVSLCTKARRETAQWDRLDEREDDIILHLPEVYTDSSFAHVTVYDLLLYPIDMRTAALYVCCGEMLSCLTPAWPSYQSCTIFFSTAVGTQLELHRLELATSIHKPALTSADPVLKVAYESFDFRAHPIGWMMTGVMQAHNRSRLTLSSYYYGGLFSDIIPFMPDDFNYDSGDVANLVDASAAFAASKGVAWCDHSPQGPRGGGCSKDALVAGVDTTAQIMRASDAFYFVHHSTDDAVVSHIAAAGTDILVDFMVHTTCAWLCLCRLSRVMLLFGIDVFLQPAAFVSL